MAALGEVSFLMPSIVLCECVFFSRMMVFFWRRCCNTSQGPKAKSPCICIVNHQGLLMIGILTRVLSSLYCFFFVGDKLFLSSLCTGVRSLDTITFFHLGGNFVGMNLPFCNMTFRCAFSASITLSDSILLAWLFPKSKSGNYI